jgi:NAD(P)-dependent dehydrogenase (short-subunit alcohol dehydrogenase family)
VTDPSAPLAGRTALVTGAAKRIGRATALALAREGANVVIHYRSSRQDAEALAAEIAGQGRRAWALAADLADPGEADRLVPRAADLAGPLDIVVNSASIFPASTLATMTVEDVAGNMQVNAMAPFLVGRAFHAAGRSGVIVNFLDTRIVHYDAAHAAYHVSKRACFNLTRMMALEFAPAVRVNAVAPGLILPPPGEDESYLRRLAGQNPLGRHGSLEGVTDAVLFLVRAEFITGQVIYVDGGFHMKGSVYGSG